jgi:DNA polymerase/3'-5' exonuclease PolX
MRLTEAARQANIIVERLRPFTTIINIAGSIRREKSEVKDIEIVCLPHYVRW